MTTYITGNHPEKERARKLLNEAIAIDKAIDKEGRIKSRKLKPLYKHTVMVDTYKEWGEGDSIEGLRIVSKLMNKDIFDAHMQRYGSIFNPPDESKRSVFYHRINGVLLHKCGGWLLLKENAIVSDSDWDKILVCNIPKELLR
jgi:hypothetical protein